MAKHSVTRQQTVITETHHVNLSSEHDKASDVMRELQKVPQDASIIGFRYTNGAYNNLEISFKKTSVVPSADSP